MNVRGPRPGQLDHPYPPYRPHTAAALDHGSQHGVERYRVRQRTISGSGRHSQSNSPRLTRQRHIVDRLQERVAAPGSSPAPPPTGPTRDPGRRAPRTDSGRGPTRPHRYHSSHDDPLSMFNVHVPCCSHRHARVSTATYLSYTRSYLIHSVQICNNNQVGPQPYREDYRRRPADSLQRPPHDHPCRGGTYRELPGRLQGRADPRSYR